MCGVHLSHIYVLYMCIVCRDMCHIQECVFLCVVWLHQCVMCGVFVWCVYVCTSMCCECGMYV